MPSNQSAIDLADDLLAMPVAKDPVSIADDLLASDDRKRWLMDMARNEGFIETGKKSSVIARKRFELQFPGQKFTPQLQDDYWRERGLAERARGIITQSMIDDNAIDAARRTPPRDRADLIRVVSDLAKRFGPNAGLDSGGRALKGAARASLDIPENFAKLIDRDRLSDEDAVFVRQLLAAKSGGDPLVRQEDNWFERNVIGAAQMAPGMAAGIATGSPVAGALFWGAQTFPDERVKMLEAGLTGDNANVAAALSSAMQGAIETINFDQFPGVGKLAGPLKSRIANMVVKTAASYGKELGETALQSLTSDAVAAAGQLLESKGVPEEARVTIGRAIENAGSQVWHSAGPLALLMAPGTAKAVKNVALGSGAPGTAAGAQAESSATPAPEAGQSTGVTTNEEGQKEGRSALLTPTSAAGGDAGSAASPPPPRTTWSKEQLLTPEGAAEFLDASPNRAMSISQKKTPSRRTDMGGILDAGQHMNADERARFAFLLRDAMKARAGQGDLAAQLEAAVPQAKGAPPTPEGRPDLSTPLPPGHADAQRVLDTVDDVRTKAGQPAPASMADIRAEATRRLASDYEGEKARLLDSAKNGRPVEAVDVAAANFLVARETIESLASGSDAKLVDAMVLADARRRIGTTSGRALAAFANPYKTARAGESATTQAPGERMVASPAADLMSESPSQQRLNVLIDAMLSPPRKVQTRIDSAVEAGHDAKADELRRDWARKAQEAFKRRGLDPANLQQISEDEIATSQALAELHASGSGAADKAYEYWANVGLLSGPQTHIKNSLSNLAHGAYEFTGRRLSEALANTVLRRPGAASFGELPEAWKGLFPGIAVGAQHALRVWRTGGSARESKLDIPRAAIRGRVGSAVRTFGSALSAADAFLRVVTTRMEVGALAHRRGVADGLAGEALSRRIASEVLNPASESWQAAIETGDRVTFKEPLGRAGEHAMALRNAFPGARWIAPFVTAPWNIFKIGARGLFAPGAAIGLARRVYRAHQSGSAKDWARVPASVGENLVSWALLAAVAGTNSEDDPWITGGIAEWDPRQRDAARRGAPPPMSIKIGGKWYGYGWLEPFATGIGLTVDFANAIKSGDTKRIAATPFKSVIGQIKSKTFLDGVADVLTAVQSDDPIEGIAKWASSFASSWVPNLIRQPRRLARNWTPERGVWGKADEFWDRLGRRTLQSTELGIVADVPKVDLWGRDVVRQAPWTPTVFRLLSPIEIRDANVFIGDQVLMRYNARPDADKPIQPRAPSRDYKVGDETRSMTDAQYEQFARLSGLTGARLVELLALDPERSDERDVNDIAKAVSLARDRAKDVLLREWGGGMSAVESPDELAQSAFDDWLALQASHASQPRPPRGKDATKWREQANDALEWLARRREGGVTDEQIDKAFRADMRRRGLKFQGTSSAIRRLRGRVSAGIP